MDGQAGIYPRQPNSPLLETHYMFLVLAAEKLLD
jgi:hypothetical protein